MAPDPQKTERPAVPYVNLQQLIDRYGQTLLVDLTDRGAVATGAIDETVVNRALADTDAMINARIALRYDLASVAADVPELLVDIALCIAIWKLYRFEPPQKIKDDYTDAKLQLREIGDGTSRLPIEGGGEPQGTGETGARVTDRERPFTEETMKGWI